MDGGGVSFQSSSADATGPSSRRDRRRDVVDWETSIHGNNAKKLDVPCGDDFEKAMFGFEADEE